VIRHYGGDDNSVDVVEMQNMSAVTEAKSWTNPISPSGVSRSSTHFTGYYDGGDHDTFSVQTWKKKNSLYDYGMGSSVRGHRGGGDSVRSS
jgi:hypothetical protein